MCTYLALLRGELFGESSRSLIYYTHGVREEVLKIYCIRRANPARFSFRKKMSRNYHMLIENAHVGSHANYIRKKGVIIRCAYYKTLRSEVFIILFIVVVTRLSPLDCMEVNRFSEEKLLNHA